MTDEELTAAIADAVEKATSGLKVKNAEILADNKKLKGSISTIESERDEAASRIADASGDIDAIKASHKKELDKLTLKITEQNTHLNTLLIDNAIASGLAEHKVSPKYHRAVTALLKAEAELKGTEAVVGDKSLADHLASYFASDDGRHFVDAPMNSGAGATGSTAKASAWTKAPETAEEFERYMKLANENPAEANALAKEWGFPSI